MAGLVPAIHGFLLGQKDVDARHKGGHDEPRLPIAHPMLCSAGKVSIN